MLLFQPSVGLRVMAMKGYSTFPKAPILLEPHHEIAQYHLQDTHWRGLTLLQRTTQCILQPQLTGKQVGREFTEEKNFTQGKRKNEQEICYRHTHTHTHTHTHIYIYIANALIGKTEQNIFWRKKENDSEYFKSLWNSPRILSVAEIRRSFWIKIMAVTVAEILQKQ